MKMNIIWKPIIIDNIITNYEVNNIGKIRSIIKFPHITRYTILHPSLNGWGYLQVVLYLRDRKITRKIHRLVAEAFIPNPENKPQVNHINGIKTDNRIENLEWCTNSENVQHAFDIGLARPLCGSKNPTSIYLEDTINKICIMLENHVPMKLICNLINVTKDLVKDIKRGSSWKHISSQYNINYKEKYDYQKIKYIKLKKILSSLGMFKNINLYELLYSKHITHKRKLIRDMKKDDYIIFLDSELYCELNKDNKDDNDYD